MKDNKNVVGIRVDANAVLGLGHLMRCMAFAYAMQEQELECIFYTAEEAAGKLLEEKGFCSKILYTDYTRMEAELPGLKKMLEDDGCGLVLVDSYQITQKYLNELMECCPVYYMDDTGEDRLQANGIVDYNIYGPNLGYEKWCGPETDLLLGVEYAPVKKAFLETPYMVRDRVSKIMITMGGSDALNIAGRLSQRLLQCLAEDVGIDIICGRFNPHLDALKTLEEQNPRIHIMVDVPDMWNKMAAADLVVSAAGSTMYELSAMGVPTVCCYYVENQRRIAEAFASGVGMLNAGDFAADSESVLEILCMEINRLVNDTSARKVLSERMMQIVDGRGPQRLAKKLCQRLLTK